MHIKTFARPALVLALGAALAACGYSTQVSSGKEYLSRYSAAASQAGDGSGRAKLDAQVREAANVEPTLVFPARIGIARLKDARLVPVAAAEAEAWLG